MSRGRQNDAEWMAKCFGRFMVSCLVCEGSSCFGSLDWAIGSFAVSENKSGILPELAGLSRNWDVTLSFHPAAAFTNW